MFRNWPEIEYHRDNLFLYKFYILNFQQEIICIYVIIFIIILALKLDRNPANHSVNHFFHAYYYY